MEFASGGRIPQLSRIVKLKEWLKRADELALGEDEESAVERKRILEVETSNAFSTSNENVDTNISEVDICNNDDSSVNLLATERFY